MKKIILTLIFTVCFFNLFSDPITLKQIETLLLATPENDNEYLHYTDDSFLKANKIEIASYELKYDDHGNLISSRHENNNFLTKSYQYYINKKDSANACKILFISGKEALGNGNLSNAIALFLSAQKFITPKCHKYHFYVGYYLGYSYLKSKMYYHAIPEFKKAAKYSEIKGYKHFEAIAYGGVGYCYIENKPFERDSALFYERKAFTYTKNNFPQ